MASDWLVHKSISFWHGYRVVAAEGLCLYTGGAQAHVKPAPSQPHQKLEATAALLWLSLAELSLLAGQQTLI